MDAVTDSALDGTDLFAIKKRATPAGSCLPFYALFVSKQCKTARLILSNFL